MKKIIIFFCSFFILIIGLVIYPNWSTNSAELEVNKLMTDNCILSSIARVLVEYYSEYKDYPEADTLHDLIINKGYPSHLGCGPTNIKYSGNIIDTSGNLFFYDHVSSELAIIYFENSSDGDVYRLKGNRFSGAEGFQSLD